MVINKRGVNGVPSSSFIINSKYSLLRYLIKTGHKDYIRITDKLYDYLQSEAKYTSTGFIKKLNDFMYYKSIFNKNYWLQRGHTLESAKQKVASLQSKNSNKRIYKDGDQPSQIKFWTNKGLTENEAKQHIKEMYSKSSMRCKLYWLDKGYSEEEAKQKVSEYQSKDLSGVDWSKRLNATKVEYWLNKGYNEEEAKQKVSERQTTFTKEKAILELGIIKGQEKIDSIRQKKRDTFHARPQEEQDAINLSRARKNSGYFTKKWFERNPEYKDKPGTLYYFKYTINNIDYWKIGITSLGFNKRFNRTIQKRYNIRDIEIKQSNMYDCFLEEQELLSKYDKYRTKTELSTETFNVNIKDIYENSRSI